MNNPTLFSLPVKEKISSYITLRQLDELPVIIVSHPKVNAAVSLQGAQLLSWQPDGEKACIWLSKNSLFKKNTAIRGGIPICWPHGLVWSRNPAMVLLVYKNGNWQPIVSIPIV